VTTPDTLRPEVPDEVTAALLNVRGLTCDIETEAGTAHVLRGVDVTLERGRTLGIVGESGSGKSMLLKSVLGLAPTAARVGGTVTFDGTDLLKMPTTEKSRFLGRRVGVVFQNPMTSLNPVVAISRQMAEASRYHLGLSKNHARELATDLLKLVGIPNAVKRLDDYPHQFSGGMRQRVMIAMALTCEPELLVADEATTALDVTIQKEILDLLERLQRERQMAMILVSHDLSVVSGRTDEVMVMYGGKVVERAPTRTIFPEHQHQYTRALLAAIPRLDLPAHTRLQAIPGQPPSLIDPPAGCPFAPRCAAAVERCHTEWPPAESGSDPRHVFHCWVPVDRSALKRAVSKGLTA
jgi:peptide/nickel transport system ATP-binding protein